MRHARQARISTLMQRCRCLALTDPPLAVVSHLLETAEALSVPALWDPGVAVRTGWSGLAPIARRADSLLLNETEAEQLFDTSDPRTILRRLDLNGAPKAIILKEGSRGSVLLDCATGASDHIPPLPLTALGLSPISTVGCGDVFLGVYAAYLSRGHKRQAALLMAAAAAGLNATRPETRGGPTANEMERLLAAAAAAGYPPAAGKEPLQ
jgi:sugar/nucleoside kinase (ribokinase family)